MGEVRRVLWGEGVFLRPQHFQQQVLHTEWLVRNAAQGARSHPWGITEVAVDAEGLAAGILRLNRVRCTMPDGTVIDAPSGEPLPSAREIATIPNLASETLVHLCLPALNAFGGNSLAPGQSASRPTRYTVDQVAVSDLFTGALESDIAVLRANCLLMTDGENRDGFVSLPVARMQKSATGVWRMDTNYIPPLLDTAGSESLRLLLRRLLDILLVKSQALSGMHRERAKTVVEYTTSDIASFWLLHTVNRSFPLLNHALNQPAIHPEFVYGQLAQLAGELLTFSSTLALTEIPLYDHRDLTGTFTRLDRLVRELLETVISARYAVIPLVNTKPSFHVGRLESDKLVEADFYLSVESEAAAAQLIENVPMKLKVGSPDDVEKILNSALHGVRVVHAAQTPAPIPVRIGNHYFALERQGQIFERMLKSRSICIYTPQTLPPMKLELIAVFR